MHTVLHFTEKQANHSADLLLNSLKDPKTLMTLLAGAGAGGLLGTLSPVDTDHGRKLSPAERRNKMLQNAATYGLLGAGAAGAGKLGYDFLTDPTIEGNASDVGSWRGFLNLGGLGAGLGALAGAPIARAFKGNHGIADVGERNMGTLTKALATATGVKNLNPDHMRQLLQHGKEDSLRYLTDINGGTVPAGLDGDGLQKAIRVAGGSLPNSAMAGEDLLFKNLRGAGTHVHGDYLNPRSILGMDPGGWAGKRLESLSNRMHFDTKTQAIARPTLRGALTGGGLGALVNAGLMMLPKDELLNFQE